MQPIKVSELRQAVAAVSQRGVELRRTIHANPELSSKEYETSALVKKELSEAGIPYKDFDDYTGVIGLIEGAKPGPVYAIRADMDALPIQEVDTERPYCSKNPGVMHACGHDVHTAVLLSAAKVINQFKDRMSGSVKLLFQPAEEATNLGAREMVARGCLEDPHVDEVYGLNVDDQRPCGTVGTRIGPTNASSDRIVVKITGKSAHGTRPELGVDAVFVAAEVVVGLHAMLSRRVGALKNISLNIGVIQGGTAANIIAQEASLQISLRTTDPAMRPYMFEEITRTINGICELNLATAEIEISEGCRSVVNDKECVEHVYALSERLLGPGHFTFTPELCMGSEDFSCYTQHIPSCFYDLGIRNEERGITARLHNCHFDVDENAIPIGILMHSAIVLEKLCGIVDD